jgi:hypothetical protein
VGGVGRRDEGLQTSVRTEGVQEQVGGATVGISWGERSTATSRCGIRCIVPVGWQQCLSPHRGACPASGPWPVVEEDEGGAAVSGGRQGAGEADGGGWRGKQRELEDERS